MHLFSLMAPQQPKKVTMMTMTLTTIRMMAAVEYTVIDTLESSKFWRHNMLHLLFAPFL